MNVDNSTNRYEKMIIAIDGPSGAGKSTASKMLAGRLGFLLLNTGLLYRGLAYVVETFKITANWSKESVEKYNDTLSLLSLDGNRLLFDGEDITKIAVSNKMSQLASDLSKVSYIRELVNGMARSIAYNSEIGVVTEGRDTCTVLFPRAELKIYMDADLDFRASMRHKQLEEQGIESTYEEVLSGIMKRDEQDSNRKIAPLTKSPDAVHVDTSYANLDSVVDWIISLVDVLSGRPVSVSWKGAANAISPDLVAIRVLGKKVTNLERQIGEITKYVLG